MTAVHRIGDDTPFTINERIEDAVRALGAEGRAIMEYSHALWRAFHGNATDADRVLLAQPNRCKMLVDVRLVGDLCIRTHTLYRVWNQ